MPCISYHLACMFVSGRCVSTCIYVCMRYLCVCTRAPFVRMYVYVGPTEGGMVDLSSGWRRTGQDGHPAMHTEFAPNDAHLEPFETASTRWCLTQGRARAHGIGWPILLGLLCERVYSGTQEEVGGVEEDGPRLTSTPTEHSCLPLSTCAYRRPRQVEGAHQLVCVATEVATIQS